MKLVRMFLFSSLPSFPFHCLTVCSYFSCAASPLPQFDAEALAQLLSMGFPENRCHKALLATGNSSADLALGWLLEHSEDHGEIANDANHFLRADQSSTHQFKGERRQRCLSLLGSWCRC